MSQTGKTQRMFHDAPCLHRQVSSILSLEENFSCLYGANIQLHEPSVQEPLGQEMNGCLTQRIDLFPGVLLIFQDIHAERLDFGETPLQFPPTLISIQHCREGRFEGAYRNGECFYLGAGDLSINLPICQPECNAFPLSHYHGLNLIIDPEPAQAHIRHLEQLMGPLRIDFQSLHDRLQQGNHLVIYRENSLQHVLSELYGMRCDAQGGHIKMKVLELLLHICALDAVIPMQPQYFSRSQVRIIKSIHAYLTEHPERHHTLEALSEQFDIPLTSMKTCFKGVYGLSIGAYLREYRLQLAAERLKETTCRIGDIAFQIGYESPSKFTEAFRRKFSCTPSAYRKAFFHRF